MDSPENRKSRLFAEFLKFGITGGLGTITNLLIFFLLVDMAGFPEIPVSIGCFVIAGTQNYILNHLWSFREYTDKVKLSIKKWAAFLLGALLGFIVNIFVMTSIINNFDLPWKFIAQACGIAAGMLINFFVSKFIVFRKNKDAV